MTLTRRQRRLLKLCNRVDPNPVTLTAGEHESAKALERLEYVEITSTFAGRYTGARLTEKGRSARV